MKRDTFLRIFHYCTEILLVYLLVFIYFIHENIIPPLIPFVSIVLGGAVLIAVLFRLIKSRAFSIVILAGILNVGIGLLVGFHIELIIILTLFNMWRVPIHINEAELKNENIVLGITFFSGIIVFFIGFNSDYLYRHIILMLTSLQILLIMLGRFIDGFLYSASNNKESNRRQIKWILVLVGLLIAITLLLTFALPLIKPTFFFLLKGVFYFFGILLMPLLYFLLGQDNFFARFYDAQFPKNKNNEQDYPFGDELISPEHAPIDPTFWWVLFALIIIGIIVVIWRNYTIGHHTIQVKQKVQSTSSLLVNNKPTSLAKRKPPKDYVRRRFFELERLAAKFNMGRRRDETAKEWLDRIGYTTEENDMVIYYENVRYNEVPLTHDEKEQYDKIVKELKRKMKDHKK
ncbi:hypothetical protein [Fredinandcohnia quinoae]|uniref:DUF4129 domain-containing protein n=1 Tax=Fredinandcohnia quinoae TaxID=2918902 RepID=A0AAW5ED23_9BACI|nr:hypothetical protein [Fredinandcohnia sp. SECRCQ15]MCH1626664.1 hypothetical protein [Fredinandcohnia sp. SECRCQ15]